MKYRIILITILAILLVIFALQNTEIVATKLYFWEIKIPRALLILLCILGGIIIGMVFSNEKIKRPFRKNKPKKNEE